MTIRNNQDGDENVIKKIRIIKVVRKSGGEGKKSVGEDHLGQSRTVAR